MTISPSRYRYRLKNLISILIVQLAVALPLSTHARDIAGVDVAENATVDGQQLTLNGAGIRRKFFFKIYVGALYLTTPISSAMRVLDDPGPKRIHMHFLYDEVSRDKLNSGWHEGFENNLTEAEMVTLQPKLTKFNQIFTDMHKGDTIDIDFIPARGVTVTVNGENKGEVAGNDFSRALLSVWLGKEPADSSLKEAMLGTEEE